MIEKSVLSSIFQELPIIALGISEGLTADCFYSPMRRKFYNIFKNSHIAGDQKNDLTEIVQMLDRRGELEGMGGAAAIAEIYSYTPTSSHFSHHVELLKASLISRISLAHSHKSASLSQDCDSTPEDIISEMVKAQNSMQELLTPSCSIYSALESSQAFMAHMEDIRDSGGILGLKTGIPILDNITGGLRRHTVTVIAGRPSDGKSVMMLQIAANMLRGGKKVMVFSLEMTKEEVVSRMCSYVGRVHGDTLTNPKTMTNGDLGKIRTTLGEIAKMQLSIVDKGGMTMDEIESLAIKQRDAHGLDMIVVDYLQIITRNGRMSSTEGLEDVSQRVKQLSKKMDCPVVTGSQLNDDGKLKAARKIGEDASIVLKIVPDKGLSVDKNRDGKRGDMLNLHHVAGMNKFEQPQTNN